MFGRKRDGIGQDRATRQLQKSGVYTLGHGPHPYLVDGSIVEAVRSRSIYGFWAGAWYAAVLSILLFWLPPFGQMIAGYVGGRKAGTPLKGAAAAFVPMSLVIILFAMRFMGGFVEEINWLLGLPSAAMGFLSSAVPVLGPVFGFMFGYIDAFASAMWSGEFFIFPYVLTVIFGYVGGILSLQHARETDAGHPFQPISQPSPVHEAPSGEPAGQEVIMGSVPKGWKMKRDCKKGKW